MLLPPGTKTCFTVVMSLSVVIGALFQPTTGIQMVPKLASGTSTLVFFNRVCWPHEWYPTQTNMLFFTIIPFSILLATVGAATDSLLWETVQQYEKNLAPATPTMSPLKSDSSGQPKAMIHLEFGGLMGSGIISLTGTAKPVMITGFPINGPSSPVQSTYESSVSDVISRQNYSSPYSNVSPTSTKNVSYSYSFSTGGFPSSPTATLPMFQGDGQRLVPPSLLGLMAAIMIQLAAYFIEGESGLGYNQIALLAL